MVLNIVTKIINWKNADFLAKKVLQIISKLSIQESLDAALWCLLKFVDHNLNL